MNQLIEDRAMRFGEYIIEHRATVRSTASRFGISKSTVHKDLTERIVKVNPYMAVEVRKILDINKKERHIRGGIATRNKYLRNSTA